MENLSNNQEFSLVGDHFLHSHHINVRFSGKTVRRI